MSLWRELTHRSPARQSALACVSGDQRTDWHADISTMWATIIITMIFFNYYYHDIYISRWTLPWYNIIYFTLNISMIYIFNFQHYHDIYIYLTFNITMIYLYIYISLWTLPWYIYSTFNITMIYIYISLWTFCRILIHSKRVNFFMLFMPCSRSL